VRAERSRECLHYYIDAGSSYRDSVTDVLVRGKIHVQLGGTPRIGMAEDAPSGFLDYALSLPLRGIPLSPLEMTGLQHMSQVC